MGSPSAAPAQHRWSRRRRVGLLIAFYLVAFSATIPFIEVGQRDAASLAAVHHDLAAQCRRFEAVARAQDRNEESDRLDRSARSHDHFAAIYQAEAKRTRLTWLAFLIREALL